MKQIIIIIASILISYLFNAYAYNSFSPINYPTASKFLTCFGVLTLVLIRSIVYSESLEGLRDEVKKLKNK